MPWRETRDPYRILVSEIMLQQTQVARVLGFYKNFIKRFPNFRALARAKSADVLRAWQGLGYNRRALALHRLAKEIVENYGGRLPRDTESLLSLPGIGKYTASAIRTFAFHEAEIMIETNIRRVFIHCFFGDEGKRKEKVTDDEIRRYLERTIDVKNPREWYYALMDYGAMLGGLSRSGEIQKNPNRRSARYAVQSAFTGSDREVRGKILKKFLAAKKLSAPAVYGELKESPSRILKILGALLKEGFLVKKGNYYEI